MITSLYTISTNLFVFKEFKQAFINSMTELGHSVNIFEYDQKSYKVNSCKSDINFFIVGNAKYVQPFFSKNPKIENSYKVLIWFEQLQNVENQLRIRKLFNCTIEIFKNNYLSYKDKANCIFCPLGWSKAYETDIHNILEDINCFSFGAYTHTRIEFIKNFPKEVVFQLNTFGNKRDINILRSKINLIIPAIPEYFFPQLRYLLIACKEKFVLASPHIDYTPFIPNTHFKVFNKFKDDYTYWINAANERTEIAQNAYKDLKSNYNYTVFLKEALKKL
jgi:hypothetical protein